MVSYVVKGKWREKLRTIFESKMMGLPAKTGFSELFSEMQKWDGKLPKQSKRSTKLSHVRILN